jgi:hypothetical protein
VTDPTGFVLTANVAVRSPAATVTVAGTTAAELSLDREIAAPPAGAGAFNVTVPVDAPPPRTTLGLKETDVTPGGLIVSVAESEDKL